ncbi:ABC transporter ATP-binding protein [Flavobacterium sp. DGU38]|uniref:ABC transporter ATP-binding protein n=1 Tax=Flavobacterium calami TaxID=3139144 RepID=A0ABU9IJN0_9FLAO
MKDIILKAENISKQYRLGQVGTGTLSHDLNRWWHKIRGKENPYLKIGEVNDRSTKGTSDYVWALQDINFEVERGEVLGIIGKNGAGKSTLLKILSKVTAPTTGSIKSRGRIASLLEVGTGFNGEMTGRENIFLNGAILGMTKKEIASKLDEIIEFSGCERYIDTPVKRYSSGMTVRLAFAVAAFLEPEILVIDEVLAVGDAEFQKKAIGKMQDISKGEGRTVLFVSHNMAAVKSLCTKLIVLKNGAVFFEGDVDEGIAVYLNAENDNFDDNAIYEFIKNQKDDSFILKNVFLCQDFSSENNFYTNKEIIINIEYEILKDILGLRIGFDLIDLTSGVVIFRSFHDDLESDIKYANKGKFSIRTSISENFLKNGSFGIKLAIGIHNTRWIVYDDNLVLKFNMTNVGGLNSAFTDSRPGFIMPQLNWQYVDN